MFEQTSQLYWVIPKSKPPNFITLSNIGRFLQGISIACYAEPCISYGRVVCLSVCPSACPSVTRWHWLKTTQARITKSSVMDSPRTAVFRIKSSSRNSKGFILNEGVKWEWCRKNSQLSVNKSQKWCKIGPKLLLMTNRKSHVPFWLVPKSTTLDDLERLIRTLFQKRGVFWRLPQKFERR